MDKPVAILQSSIESKLFPEIGKPANVTSLFKKRERKKTGKFIPADVKVNTDIYYSGSGTGT